MFLLPPSCCRMGSQPGSSQARVCRGGSSGPKASYRGGHWKGILIQCQPCKDTLCSQEGVRAGSARDGTQRLRQQGKRSGPPSRAWENLGVPESKEFRTPTPAWHSSAGMSLKWVAATLGVPGNPINSRGPREPPPPAREAGTLPPRLLSAWCFCQAQGREQKDSLGPASLGGGSVNTERRGLHPLFAELWRAPSLFLNWEALRGSKQAFCPPRPPRPPVLGSCVETAASPFFRLETPPTTTTTDEPVWLV